MNQRRIEANSFTDIVVRYTAHVDYEIVIFDRGAVTTVTAIHSGYVEPLTGELAEAVAGNEHNAYEMRCLKLEEASAMRVPTAHYSEMRLNALVRRSQAVLALDGVPGELPKVHLGGRNMTLKSLLAEALGRAGFETAAPSTPGAAHDPTRYYNAASQGGVLLELSAGLRREMAGAPLQGASWSDPVMRLEPFHRFVAAARSALEQYNAYLRSDPEQALKRFEEITSRIPRSMRAGEHPHG